LFKLTVKLVVLIRGGQVNLGDFIPLLRPTRRFVWNLIDSCEMAHICYDPQPLIEHIGTISAYLQAILQQHCKRQGNSFERIRKLQAYYGGQAQLDAFFKDNKFHQARIDIGETLTNIMTELESKRPPDEDVAKGKAGGGGKSKSPLDDKKALDGKTKSPDGKAPLRLSVSGSESSTAVTKTGPVSPARVSVSGIDTSTAVTKSGPVSPLRVSVSGPDSSTKTAPSPIRPSPSSTPSPTSPIAPTAPGSVSASSPPVLSPTPPVAAKST